MWKLLKKIRRNARRSEPPSNRSDLFVFNVGEIVHYLRHFLKESVGVNPKDQIQHDLVYYALFIATRGWEDAQLGEPLQDLQVEVLSNIKPKTSDAMEIQFRLDQFKDRYEQYDGIFNQILSGIKPDGTSTDIGEGSRLLVDRFVGLSTGYHMPPHLMFGGSLEFIGTVEFVKACSSQFESASLD